MCSRFFVLSVSLVGFLASEAAAADLPNADALIDAMDQHMTFESRTAKLRMTVEGRKRTRVFEILSYGRGVADSAMTYLKPRRDKGTKMLKLGDDLWIYMPNVDRVQKISGHMLRQGMMGSDLSYEDMMTSQKLRESYRSEVTGSEVVDGRDCWVLEMSARDETVTYPKRKTWIVKDEKLALKQELYALSGMHLKTWTMSKVEEFPGGRRFPTKMVIVDHIKKNSRTTLEFSDVVFGVELPREVFSKRWLERK